MSKDKRDFDYYIKTGKVFWIINKDVNDNLKANQTVPCIFIEERNGNERYIIQFDKSIKYDNFKYTTWRNFIGQTYNIYVNVLLIDVKTRKLFTLNNKEIKFESLKRNNDCVIQSKYLAKFDYIK